MQKNKEDDFLGDKITSNIKYSDNEWQSQGTVDRGSTYTKEPILHLLFEGFDYSRDLGDYTYYIPRATTGDKSGKAYAGAKLQHDIYNIDSQFYSATAISSTKNIFSLNTYLEEAFALTNPVYDDKSTEKLIPLFDIDSTTLVIKNGTLKNTTLFNIFKYLLPKYYEDPTITYKSTYDIYFKQFFLHYGVSGKITLASTFDTFWGLLSTEKRKNFLDDFSLHYHNNDTIKMPFFNRGDKIVNSEITKEEADTRTYKTRFIANSLTKALYNTSTVLHNNYLEYLNDILEESIFANNLSSITKTIDGKNVNIFYDNRIDNNSTTTNLELAKNLWNSTYTIKENGKEVTKDSIYYHISQEDKVYKATTVINYYVQAIDSIETNISLYCPDVFINYSASNSPESSWGIHFINEENTESLFQDTNNTYKLFNNVIFGYKLVDTLIAYRTVIGGMYDLIKNYNYEPNISEGTSSCYLDTSLNFRYRGNVNASFYDDELQNDGNIGYKGNGYHCYPTITAINTIYKIGHGLTINSYDTTSSIPQEVGTDFTTTGGSKLGQYYTYEFAPEIEKWLANECFLFKGKVYGDYVEELNFLQDLTPDSDVHFNSIRLKKTEIPYTRYQDSKYEIPYVEQTAPLLNNTKDNEEGIGVYASDALASVGNLKKNNNVNVTPPFLYDWDKGLQTTQMDSSHADSRVLSNSKNQQRINSKDNKGNLVVENRITSPTIDELWTFLKYLTESDGSGTDQGINERLPKFYGMIANNLNTSYSVSAPGSTTPNTVNPLATNITFENGSTVDKNTTVIDILNWEPQTVSETRLHYSGSNEELEFGGFKVTRYIEKIYDYATKPFRRSYKTRASAYEYNTELSTDKNTVTGYLDKLYNSAILNFDLPQMGSNMTTLSVDPDLLYADILGDPKLDKTGTIQSQSVGQTKSGSLIFTTDNDAKLITNNESNIVHATFQRKKAFEDNAKILTWHKAKDGKNDLSNSAETSYHNHFKKYLDNPKNLKEIERDLETIRQNMQMLAEFMVINYPSMGYADRSTNRGTIHQLHKNAYAYDSTYLYIKNNTKVSGTKDEKYNTTVPLNKISNDSLNNVNDSLTVTDLDKRVVFDDGDYTERYLRNVYDTKVIDLDSNVNENTRGLHPMYRPNETLLSETYLAADGTWRSLRERTTLPVIYDEH